MRRRLLPIAALLGLAACVPPQQTIVMQQPRGGCDTSFRVINNSGGTVEQLYFSHASQGSWGNDQLGQNVLPPGRSVSYRAANTGYYDFRVVWQNGQTAELRQVNVCVTSNIVITGRGLSAS
jgi:hypothetical protein